MLINYPLDRAAKALKLLEKSEKQVEVIQLYSGMHVGHVIYKIGDNEIVCATLDYNVDFILHGLCAWNVHKTLEDAQIDFKKRVERDL